jgi:hypothetical protein
MSGVGMPSPHRIAAVSRPERDVHHRDGAEISRGRVHHLLDHAGGGHRAVEAGARGDGALAHTGPAGEEEEDHQQREGHL